ncbi:HEAT repeat domain-containing protein [bacterium]|nr:HEAT repeat domain-containing protein [bacterium]
MRNTKTRIYMYLVTIMFIGLSYTSVFSQETDSLDTDSIEVDIPMLDSLDRAMIDSALTLLNLRPEELGFDKMWVEDDTFRLDIVERILEHPLELPEYVDSTTAVIDTFSVTGDFGFLLGFVGDQLKVDIKTAKRKPVEWEPVNPTVTDPFAGWIQALEVSEPLRREFYEALDSLDLNDLIMAAPTLWSNDESEVNAKLVGAWQFVRGIEVDTSREVDSDRILDIISKLDLQPLLEAAEIIALTAMATAEDFSWEEYCQPQRIDSGEIEGVTGEILYYRETSWGKMVIGGRGNNVYDADFSAIIDLGGDDVYRGQCGGALGVLDKPYSLVIDLDGDDYYDSDGQPVSHGAGFFGVGVLIDKGGNDTYRSGNYSQGAGLFGIGILFDQDGDDDYRGGFFQQGAGNCGIGLLIDKGEGDDRYLSTTWAQGFASTYGYGLLYDQGGDDIYRTGGEYYHAPLLPHDYQSFSHGFGMGMRPRAGGGIGVLYDDGDGNDFYNAEVMSLGSSYWYSIGILVDGGGNDHYSLAHYGLGSGIHLSVGAFYDRSGDDQYRSRMGVVGGTPHDLSVGMFVEGDGDDYYIVSDGWGGSLTNSFGLFIDRLGNDTYATRGGGYSFGNPRWARGFAGAAIFLDLEGDDVYPEGTPAADSSIWIRGGWGVGIDLPRDVVDKDKEEPIGEIELTAEDSAKSVEELFEEASKWEVGSARESVKRARESLLTKKHEAIGYAVSEKLDTKSSLVRRLLETVIKSDPDTSGPLLLEKFSTTEDETVLKNAIWLLGAIKWEAAVEPMLDMVDRKEKARVRNSLISALGQIGDERASEKISRYIDDKKERRRLTVIGALGAISDSTTIPVLIRGLDDVMFTVRSAAIGALMKFGTPAVFDLRNYITDEMSLYPEIGMRGLGRIIDKMEEEDVEAGKMRYEAVQLFEGYLIHPSEQMRAAAVDALYRNSGETTRRIIEGKMESEYSPIVQSAYEKVVRELKKEE